MKKAISILVIMTVLLSLTISVSAEDFPAIIFGNAEYATVLPVIDGEMDDIWYATNGQIYDYVQAYQRLQFSAEGDFVYNPSAMDVYICYFGRKYKIPSGEMVDLEIL